SVWFVVEASKLYIDHTPRWPPEIKPNVPVKLHHVGGHYQPARFSVEPNNFLNAILVHVVSNWYRTCSLCDQSA
ncbi:hypothetical protein, partial [Paracoccus halophilus]|uniref:hypothetical protein n=1 Tax=Paracoccus halophilus TaxID=376733 RepID=UPI001E567507